MTPSGPDRLPPGAGAPPPGRARLAAAIADAVARVPGAVLTSGPGVAVATQYRGGRVAGIRLDPDGVTVRVVATALPLPPLIEAVSAAASDILTSVGDPRPVHVHVVDLDLDLDIGRPPSGRST